MAERAINWQVTKPGKLQVEGTLYSVELNDDDGQLYAYDGDKRLGDHQHLSWPINCLSSAKNYVEVIVRAKREIGVL